MNIILLFDSTYPYFTGGIETWVYNVCEKLVKNNNITILTVKNFRDEKVYGSFNNINPKINIIPVKNMSHIPILKHFVHKHIAELNSFATANQMYKKLKEVINLGDKHYIIALGTVFMPVVAIKIKKRFSNVKVIASCRGPEPEVIGKDFPGLGLMAQYLQRRNLIRMDAVWANGEDTKSLLNKKGFECVVIKNGVDYYGLNLAKKYDYSKIGLRGVPIIATIGTVKDIKGYNEIIKAVALINNELGYKVHFVGIGKASPYNKNKFENLAKKHNVEQYVHLIGEHRNVVEYAKGADVMLCTSGGGGYGMSILESMVSKTPIVAWDNDVHTQLLTNGKSAILVKAWDYKELAKGIKYVLDNKSSLKGLGELANKKAKDFDWDIVVRSICENLKEIED